MPGLARRAADAPFTSLQHAMGKEILGYLLGLAFERALQFGDVAHIDTPMSR